MNARHFVSAACAVYFFLNLDAQGVSDKDFQFGIGFYYKTADGMLPFAWPVPDLREKGNVESCLVTLSEDTEFYAYGLDISKSGVPPHVLGFKWGMQLRNGTNQGDWALRFVPVNGLNQKTYRIAFDGPMIDLASGRQECAFWHMDLPLLNGIASGEAKFVFRFGSRAEAEARKQAIARQLQEAFSKRGVHFKGSLNSGFGFMSAQSEFFVEFDSYDPASGRLSGRIWNLSSFPELNVSGSCNGSQVSLTCMSGDFEMQMNLDTTDGLILTGKTGGLMPTPVSINLTAIQKDGVQPVRSNVVNKSEGSVHPETGSHLLKEEDVSRWSKEQIQYALNEIYARYGLYFKDENVRSRFLKFDWYQPDQSRGIEQIETMFSDIEKANVKLLGEARNSK
jgi:hypothetical protein